MKKLKTKKCANPNCDESFDIKNTKKRFCCLPCKNQANYMYRKDKYSWEVEMLKGRNKNIQIMEYLWNNRRFSVTEKELQILGFDFSAGFMYSVKVKGTKIFRYGNIGLQLLSANEVKLTDLKKINL